MLLIVLILIINFQFDLSKVFQIVDSVDRSNILIYTIVFLIIQLLKGLRTKILVGYNLSYFANLRLVSLGNMYNTILPARAGDVYRSLALSEIISDEDRSARDVGKSIAFIVIEKVMDMISLMLIGLLILLPLQSQLEVNDVIFYSLIISFIIIMIFTLVIINSKKGSIMNKVIISVFRKMLPDKYSVQFVDVLTSGREQIFGLIRDYRKLLKLQIFSLFLMCGDVYLVYLIISQYSSVPILIGFLAAVVGFLAVVLPSLPAGVGPYQFGIAAVLFVVTKDVSIGLISSFADLMLRSIGYIAIGMVFHIQGLLEIRNKIET